MKILEYLCSEVNDYKLINLDQVVFVETRDETTELPSATTTYYIDVHLSSGKKVSILFTTPTARRSFWITYFPISVKGY